jgi:heme-degrading monooxygenase HmoA
MILEVADIHTPEGEQVEFERAIRLGLDTVLSKSPGFHSYEVRHSLETPTRYLLLIQWNSLEDHTVRFRESESYTKWSAIVRPFFGRPPEVQHFELVARHEGTEE